MLRLGRTLLLQVLQVLQVLLALQVLCCVSSAQAGEAAATGATGAMGAASETLLTAVVAEHSIAALVTHLPGRQTFTRGIVLLPGHPGIMKLRSAEAFEMRGNFLIRTRQLWLDDDTIVFSVDAPSDQWGTFSGFFRASPRYAQDIVALAAAMRERYGPLPLTIVGTSEGSISAYYAARALAGSDIKVIFTSSLFNSSANSPGLAGLDFADMSMPMLWVHHADDPCAWTPYWQARRHAEKTRSALITVRSSAWGRGAPCQALSRHGYVGVEEQTVRAMKRWVLSGSAEDVDGP